MLPLRLALAVFIIPPFVLINYTGIRCDIPDFVTDFRMKWQLSFCFVLFSSVCLYSERTVKSNDIRFILESKV